MNPQQVADLQRLLGRYGFTGGVDGKLGSTTRAAVKGARLRLGLPADSYPTPELLARLRAAR
jgi:peptidoglycan hydrolase-like protein with peptidoglycan-binding domain